MLRYFILLILVVAGTVFTGCQETAAPPLESSSPQKLMDFIPKLVAANDVLYIISSRGDDLKFLDPETGDITVVGRLHPDTSIFVTPVAMAIRPCDGSIYVWNNSNEGDEPNTSVSHGSLLKVDACTGLGTEVDPALGAQGQMGALAFHPDGRLFGMDRMLYEIDPDSGVATVIGSPGMRIAGADFDPLTGILYGVELLAPYRFGTIDLDTGAFTLIGNLGITEGPTGALAFDPVDNTLYGSAMYSVSQFFKIDLATAAVSETMLLGDVPIQGMGFAPACGEGGGDCNVPEAVEFTLVIKPGSCPNPLNPKSKGVLPMALLGSAEWDIGDIDVSSLQIGGVSPLRSSIGDVAGPAGDPVADCLCREGGPDGVADLKLKFSTQAIVATLGPVARDDLVELKLVGSLIDGTEFESAACVVIVGK